MCEKEAAKQKSKGSVVPEQEMASAKALRQKRGWSVRGACLVRGPEAEYKKGPLPCAFHSLWDLNTSHLLIVSLNFWYLWA